MARGVLGWSEREYVRERIREKAETLAPFMAGTSADALYARIIGRRQPKMLEITPEIRALARKLPVGDTRGALETIADAIKCKIKSRGAGEEAELLHFNRTADEILRSGIFPNNKGIGIRGCHDCSTLIIAVLRAQGLGPGSARYVRYERKDGTHSVVVVRAGRQTHYVDGLFGTLLNQKEIKELLEAQKAD